MSFLRRMRDVPIATKITTIMMLTSSAGLLFACGAFLARDNAVFRNEMNQRLSGLASIVGANSAAALMFDDSAAADEVLKALASQKFVVQAVLYRKDGTTFSGYRRRDAAKQPLLPLAAAASRETRRDRITILSPIYMDAQEIGQIYIEDDLGEMKERLSHFVLIVALVLAGAILVTALLTAFFQRWITRPVFQLLDTAQRVSTEGDYSLRAVSHGRDELGQLVEGFNRMLEHIEHADHQLQRHREHLEEEVERRTAELRGVNTEMLEAKIKPRRRAASRASSSPT
jgi:two-component system, sensor histidine kinase